MGDKQAGSLLLRQKAVPQSKCFTKMLGLGGLLGGLWVFCSKVLAVVLGKRDEVGVLGRLLPLWETIYYYKLIISL